MAHTITAEGGANLSPAAGHTLAAEGGANLSPSGGHVLAAEGGADLTPSAGHVLAAEGGVSLTPATPSQLTPEGGTSSADSVLAFAYEMPGDFPAGDYRRLGTSATLGAVWVLEADLGSVLLSGNDLTGAGNVWVQRDGGSFAWSLENSSDWATVSPTVYIQQTSGTVTRAECPTPASVASGGWLDIINDIDPEDEGMTLTLEAADSAAVAAEGGVDLAPSAGHTLAAEGGANLSPAAGHTLAAEGGASLSPTAPAQLTAESIY